MSICTPGFKENRDPQSQRSPKTRLLDILRAPLRLDLAERAWILATKNRPYAGLAKLTPNHYSYSAPSPRIATRYGYRFEVDISDLCGWYLYFGFRDPGHDQVVAECRPGAVVLDVGANMGLTALRVAAAVGPTGRVFAFEPDPINCARCRHHVELNAVRNVEVLEIGLSERPERAMLEVVNATNRGMNRVARPSSQAANATPVQLTTMDEFVADRALQRVDLVKVDVEGFEGAVLRGARNTLLRFRPTLFLEFDDQYLEYHGDSTSSVLNLLDDLGYQVFRADDGSRLARGQALHRVHIDVICRPR